MFVVKRLLLNGYIYVHRTFTLRQATLRCVSFYLATSTLRLRCVSPAFRLPYVTQVRAGPRAQASRHGRRRPVGVGIAAAAVDPK